MAIRTARTINRKVCWESDIITHLEFEGGSATEQGSTISRRFHRRPISKTGERTRHLFAPRRPPTSWIETGQLVHAAPQGRRHRYLSLTFLKGRGPVQAGSGSHSAHRMRRSSSPTLTKTNGASSCPVFDRKSICVPDGCCICHAVSCPLCAQISQPQFN